MMLAEQPLTLADLEAHDPTAPADRRERRFLCPMPPCAGHQRRSEHRSLALNVESGAWTCHRCMTSGKLRERWPSSRERTQIELRRAFGVRAGPALPTPPESPSAWRTAWEDAEPIRYTPGAAYLRTRGIGEEDAAACGVRYRDDFYGRPAVIFPVQDRSCTVVAMIGRYIDGRTDPKGRAAGPRSHGVFMTPGALESDRLVITEAPIDALSLAIVGVPAIALGGTSGPDWLPTVAALRPVVLALDADDAGDAGADRLTSALLTVGARLERWRPFAKDWNDALMTHGAATLSEHLNSGL